MKAAPEQFLHGERGARVVVVPHAVAAWLWREFGREMHRRNRTGEPLLEAVIVALALTAQEGSEVGTKPAPRSELGSVSGQADTVRSRDVADQLNITTRAVTKACRSGLLSARQDAFGVWQIDADSAARFVAERKSA